MGNAMTVADILDALYDGVGSTWGGDASFVDEVAAWVDDAKSDDMDDEEE